MAEAVEMWRIRSWKIQY